VDKPEEGLALDAVTKPVERRSVGEVDGVGGHPAIGITASTSRTSAVAASQEAR
jgi:hypothetical protein